MFTGIVEATGKVVKIEAEGTNKHFWLSAPFFDDIRIDQSIAHNGVCLTVADSDADNELYKVTAVKETLERSNLNDWQPESEVNLERSMRVNDRLDGHIVQGHVDQTAYVKNIREENGSYVFTFAFDEEPLHVLIEKGSCAVNGVSLTVFNIRERSFDVAIIPFTYEHTNFHALKTGDRVNIEFDMIGKYIEKLSETYLKK